LNLGMNSLNEKEDMRKRITNKINLAILSGVLVLACNGKLRAQNTAYGYLNQGNISALFSADGQLFWDGKKANFEAPKGSGKNTISASNVWIGGFDNQGLLHEAAQTYRESGADYWPGPLDTLTGKTDTVNSQKYNMVWRVTKLEIDSFRMGLSTPQSILAWPANGNTGSGYSNNLAPFIDLNHNGIYEPLKGDYPDIKGDVMLWWVFNDATTIHGKTQALPMGVEIQASAYTYNCPNDPILTNTVFVRYKIINRSQLTYSKVFMGQFADLDIGNIFDDYIGCDSASNTFYGYNSSDFDKDTIITGKGNTYSYKGYGNTLPAQSVTFLKGPAGDNGIEMPMSKFMYYNNEDNTPQGNPATSNAFYNLLSGKWLNGASLTEGGIGIGGAVSANFAFPGIPGEHANWNELALKNVPGDRRGLGSFGPFTFAPGQTKEFEVGFGFHLSAAGTTLQSLELMRDEVRQLNETYHQGALSACTGISTCTTGDSCVWPGDANNDKKGYLDDLFRIGYAYGTTGPARPFASANWVPQAATAWSQSFPDGENFKYADCNGDGKIDSMDIVPLSINYAQTHQKNGNSTQASAADPTLQIVFDKDTVVGGKVLSGKIIIGDSTPPMLDAFGVGFTLGIDPTIADQQSWQFDLIGSDIGSVGDLLLFTKPNALKGQTDISLTRKLPATKKPIKTIIGFRLVVEDNLGGYTDLDMTIQNPIIVDSKLKNIAINTQGAKAVIAHTAGINYKDISAFVNLYPNPANTNVTIDFGKYSSADIQILNMQGKELKSLKTGPDQNTTHIDIADLPTGLYIININTPNGHAVKKLSKIN